MGIVIALLCAAVLLLVKDRIMCGQTGGGGGSAYHEPDPNQFAMDQLDPSNPDDLIHLNHHTDELKHEHHCSATDQDD